MLYNIFSRKVMHCELCGREIAGKAKRVSIEGAELETCSSCAGLGTEVRGIELKGMPKGHRVMVKTRPRYRDIYTQIQGELDPEFDQLVRDAREKAGLTQEAFASQIMERTLVIKKVERKELPPDDRLRKKLEKALNIKLLIDTGGQKVEREKRRGNLTLGDIAEVKKKH
jgi:putative transcription factor